MVICENIGHVCTGSNKEKANKIFNDYVEMSKKKYGRASQENVVLMRGDEILREFIYDNWCGDEIEEKIDA